MVKLANQFRQLKPKPLPQDIEPDTGAVENPVEQPNNNETASDSTGLDGRTGETVGGRREQGELGQEGSEQSSEPSQTPSVGSTDSGVRERAQSNSVGETLTEIEGKQYRRTSINKPTESTVRAKVFRGGNVEGRGVVWNSTNEAIAHLYKSKKGDAVAETDVELKTPRVVDAKAAYIRRLSLTNRTQKMQWLRSTQRYTKK